MLEKSFYDNLIRLARENGLEPIRGREPNPEENIREQRDSRKIYNFLAHYRRFEEESRKVRVIARVRVA